MKKQKILITGAGGFTAKHFLDFLRASGVDDDLIFGTDMKSGAHSIGARRFIKADLLSKKEVADLLKKVRPDLIFHFAGINSGDDHNKLMLGNVFTTNNILEAVVKAGLRARILVIGSAAEYGIAAGAYKPIKETEGLKPITPYGVSKAAQTILALQYHRSFGTYVVVARPFNLIGAGQPAHLVCGSIVSQLRAISDGRAKSGKLILGDIDRERDFIDIRDAVSAYWQLLTSKKDISGQVFNVGSGRSSSVRCIIEILSRHCDMKISVESRKDKIRRVDVQKQAADISKIKAAIGWRSAISMERSVIDMYESAAWRR